MVNILSVPIIINHRRGPGSIPGRDMSVSGAIVEDGDGLRQVSP
jgi:hypothetical protein